jgi:hypothetical protein
VNPHEPENNPTVAHETTDADERAITKFGIALAFVIVISQLLLWWLFTHLKQREQKMNPPVPAIVRIEAPREPPEPRLQPSPRLDLEKMHQAEDAVLNHYAWVDPDRGIVRIPIERALDLVAQRGLPEFKAAEKPSAKARTPR